MALFNVRVYGILINEDNKVLISDEFERNTYFTKFPGGGLENGEGLLEGLKREFLEECNFKIEIIKHFYTTDFYAKSIFNDSQIISIYYIVKNLEPIQLVFKEKVFDFDGKGEVLQSFRWIDLKLLVPDMVTFPTEKRVVELLTKQ